MSDNFYFSTDNNKYVPIKTDLDIRHTNFMNTVNKSDNKIGLVYNTDTSDYQLKSLPKHMKIIKNLNELTSSSSENSEPLSDYTDTTDTNYFDKSQYYSDISIPSESESNFESKKESVNSNIFKQKSNFNEDLLKDVNISLDELNTQVISLCNKKHKLSNEYRNLVSLQINKILNRCS